MAAWLATRRWKLLPSTTPSVSTSLDGTITSRQHLEKPSTQRVTSIFSMKGLLFDALGLGAALGAAAIDYPAYNFSVSVDHFHNKSRYAPHSDESLNLRYWFDASNYKPGGPVIVLQSSETSGVGRLPFLVKGIVAQVTQATHGIGVILEHRYYGTFFPTPDISTENLRSLIMEQALADQEHSLSVQRVAYQKHSLSVQKVPQALLSSCRKDNTNIRWAPAGEHERSFRHLYRFYVALSQYSITQKARGKGIDVLMAQIYVRYRPLIDSCLSADSTCVPLPPVLLPFLPQPCQRLNNCAGLNTCQRDMPDAVCKHCHHGLGRIACRSQCFVEEQSWLEARAAGLSPLT